MVRSVARLRISNRDHHRWRRQSKTVWIVGAEGDNRLHGFRGDTGEPLAAAPTSAMTGLRHFQTLIATPDRLYVGADGGIYAFVF
jgi:hypothetical protein